MTKFLTFFTGLLAAFILVNIGYLFLLPKIDLEFGKTKEAYNFKNQKLKVLVFGNSTAMDGVNTEILSEKFGSAYNFSIGGASLETNYIQLSEYLQNNAKPERVLLILSSAHINYSKVNEVNPIVNYYYGNPYNLKNLKDIPLFKFRWLFVENFKKLLSSNHRSAQVIKGQLRIRSVVADNTFKKNIEDSCMGSTFYNSAGYEGMWKIIDVCKKGGVAIEIFEMPCWKNVQNNCSDIFINKQMETTNRSLWIHNLNNINKCDAILDPKKDWLSKNHLNYYGSLKITGEIIRLLSGSTPTIYSK